MDLGAGEGRVLTSAIRCGANSVVGYELTANSAHKYVFDAVLRRIFVVSSLLILYGFMLGGWHKTSMWYLSITRP